MEDNTNKKEKIKSLVAEMLKDSYEAMLKKIDTAIDSGAVNINDWDEKNAPMILPKCIVMAIMERENLQYSGRGTGYEKQIKKQVNSIRYYL